MCKLLCKQDETKGNAVKHFETLLCRFFDAERLKQSQGLKRKKTCKSNLTNGIKDAGGLD